MVAACDPSGAADSVSQSNSSTPSTLASSIASSSTAGAAVAELRPEFLFWVAPIDFDEATAGWEAFGLPDYQPRYLAMADCWEEHGYGEFAGHLREEASVRPESSANVLLVPMRRLKGVGFTGEPDFWVRSISLSAGPRGIPGGLELELKYGPDLGLRLEDFADIRRVGEMCWPQGWIPTPGMGLPEEVGVQWITRIHELDREPELAGVIADTVTPCLRTVDPFFEEALDPGDWVSRAMWAPDGPDAIEGYASEMWAMPEETLLAWGRAFADCMEPLEEARRPLRLAAREEWVDQWYDELIDFQAQDGLQTDGS
jgi:hypothetical protein